MPPNTLELGNGVFMPLTCMTCMALEIPGPPRGQTPCNLIQELHNQA